jgi:hypothetical protein
VALRAALTDPDILGLPSAHCSIVNADVWSASVVLDSIRSACEEASDTLLIYYVGHGALDIEEHDELLLALPSSDPERHYTFLEYADLRRAVLRSDARRRLIILDCCYAGQALSRGWLSSATDLGRRVSHDAAVENVCVLTATPQTRRAKASDSSGRYTAFTGALIRALEDGIEDAAEYLDLESVYRQVRRDMLGVGLPEPQLTARGLTSTIVLAPQPGLRRADGRTTKAGTIDRRRPSGKAVAGEAFCDPRDDRPGRTPGRRPPTQPARPG